jgi:cell division protein FtsQ
MWDEPRLLHTAANVLFALALALVVYAAGTVLANSPAFALHAIRVQGDLGHVSRGQIVGALQGRVSGTFFTVDVEAIRSMFQAIPWVRRAEVRRRWPDRLEVKLEEHVVLARWGQGAEGRLVNLYGEVFAGRVGSERGPERDTELPQFAGPAGSEHEVARRYALFRELLAPLSLEPHAVSLSQRQSWQARLSNGLTVQLGRDSEKDPVQERLARFVEVYPRTLGRMSRRLDYVDLRYPNGFALRVPEILRSDPPKPTRGKA